MLTDIPTGDYSRIVATIRSVELVGKDTQATIFAAGEGEEPASVDLLSLASFTEMLAMTPVPSGTYDRIRLGLDEVLLYKLDETTGVPVSLPSNGIVDIRSRDRIEVEADGILMLELDIDAEKSIKVSRRKGEPEYRFLPVISVDIARTAGEPVGTKLTWLHGNIASIEDDSSSMVVCQQRRLSDPGDKKQPQEPRETGLKNRCLEVVIDAETGVFQSDGEPGNLSSATPGDPVTVIGQLRVTNDDDDLELQAFVVELGSMADFARLKGTINAPFDDATRQFGIQATQVLTFTESSTLTGVLQTGAWIVDASGERLDELALQVGTPGEFEGVLLAGPGTLKTTLVVLDLEGSSSQSISGSVLSVDIEQNTFMLMTSPLGDETATPLQVCVSDQTEITIVTLTDTGTSTGSGSLGDLAAGMDAEVFGGDDGSGCFQAEAVRAEDDQRTPTPGNSAPTANAGPDQSVSTGESVMLDGSGSSDPDGDMLTFDWTLNVPAGSSAALDDPSGVMPVFTTDVNGDYVAELTVSDGIAVSDADLVTVSASTAPPPPNNPPTASAGPDQSVNVGDMVTLTGSGSDADGDTLSFRWSLMRPAGSTATLSATDSATTDFTADVAGEYTAELIVSDGTDDSAPDPLIVTASEPPVMLDGAQLYADNCAGCHGELSVSEYRGATAEEIQAAIDGNRGNMGFLSSLTPEEVQAIADALAN